MPHSNPTEHAAAWHSNVKLLPPGYWPSVSIASHTEHSAHENVTHENVTHETHDVHDTVTTYRFTHDTRARIQQVRATGDDPAAGHKGKVHVVLILISAAITCLLSWVSFRWLSWDVAIPVLPSFLAALPQAAQEFFDWVYRW